MAGTTRNNILLNLLGGAWSGALTLAVTPIQVKILGIEAYGLVGFIAILQMVVSVLDLGLSVSITQKVAADLSPNREESLRLVRTASTLYWCIAFGVGCTLWSCSNWIVLYWFKASTIRPEDLKLSIRLIAIFLGLRWPVALYAGTLAGLRRMDLLNAIKSGALSLRLLGGVIVLVLTRDLASFLTWNIVGAFIEVIIFAFVVLKTLPGFSLVPYVSSHAFQSIWRFSLGMNLIAILSMLLTQIDRLMISKMLPLKTLGYYSVANSVAMGISLVQTSINSAMLPTFAVKRSQKDQEGLRRTFLKADQLILFTTGLPAFGLLFFSRTILTLWVSQAVAEEASVILSLLVMGFFFNAAASNSYSLSIADGQSSTPLRANLLGFILYFPALYCSIRTFGAPGAAGAWVGLNFLYFFTLLTPIQRETLNLSSLFWLKTIFIPAFALGVGSFGSARLLTSFIGIHQTTAGLVGLFLGITLYLAGTVLISSKELQNDVRQVIKQVRQLFAGRNLTNALNLLDPSKLHRYSQFDLKTGKTSKALKINESERA